MVQKVRKMINSLYNSVLKRSSTFTVAILFGSFVYERTLDLVTDGIFEWVNKGKLWNDIKHNYEK
ncbi:ubiquinol-cytochrome C reductase complex subunit oxen [Xylocopa sonorina]|uniref:ubiquinol-cytochrome C reductase complex subunit oxen n=1 Tax=Xylocopa sonorina TaxID=1818115 RepID=UPI00403AB964